MPLKKGIGSFYFSSLFYFRIRDEKCSNPDTVSGIEKCPDTGSGIEKCSEPDPG
jgi:hypothetical protein